MKQLVCAKDVETLKEEGKTEYCICEGAIITPSARDAADSFGIIIFIIKRKAVGEMPHQ